MSVKKISAIVLAAGLSTRMGRPKMSLPWNGSTVIERVIDQLLEAGIKSIVVVSGGAHEDVKRALIDRPVQIVLNPDYQNGEMLLSMQVGLRALPDDADAAMIVLGDQPQIEVRIVRGVIQEFEVTQAKLIVPSYQMRRGHPWVVDRSLWPQLLELKTPQTLRDFMNANSSAIHYLNVHNDSILQDMDTPEDYSRLQSDRK
jgi:molybdenum cofactor cytidylyltransferase